MDTLSYEFATILDREAPSAGSVAALVSLLFYLSLSQQLLLFSSCG